MHVKIRNILDRVIFLITDEDIVLDMGWKKAQELSSAMKKALGGEHHVDVDKRLSVFKDELLADTNPTVHLISDGKNILVMPLKIAKTVADGLMSKAKLAEEHAKRDLIIADSAILLRTGLPFGLSNNNKIKKEAFKAAEDVKLPGGIEPTSLVGTPSVSHARRQ